MKERITKIFNIIFKILLVIIGILLINALINSGVYITRINLEFDNLPEELSGYKIMQLTDVHSVRNKALSDKILEKVEDEKPNIIFVTGDLIDSGYYNEQNRLYDKGKVSIPDLKTTGLMEEMAELSELYYVYGNHEMMLLDDPENNVFKRELEKLDVHVLNNEKTYIELGTSRYRLVGVQDPATLYKDEKYADVGDTREEKVDYILKDLFEGEEDMFTILLSHRPEYFPVYSKYNIDIAFTGHAHGGVVRFPFIGGLYAHAQGWFPKYTSGVHKDGRLNMIVGRGIGNSTIDFRFMNPPEIVITTLNKK